MRTIYILWLRQIKLFIRSKARLVGSLAQPIFFMVALGFGFGQIYQRAGEGNYIQFLVPGMITMAIIFTALFSGISIIWDKQFGFLKETLVAPVSRLEIMVGRTVGGATVAVLQGIIILIISYFVGFRIENYSMFILALVFMILVGLLFAALGTAIASFLNDMQGFQLIMNFLIMPLFFLSGAIFPLEGLPKALAIVTKLNPLSYGVDGLRGTLAASSHYGLSFDLVVLLLITSFLFIIGSWLFSKIEV
jgi:ABC-2 type transport system permease protein